MASLQGVVFFSCLAGAAIIIWLLSVVLTAINNGDIKTPLMPAVDKAPPVIFSSKPKAKQALRQYSASAVTSMLRD
jgi:hypothetical protein